MHLPPRLPVVQLLPVGIMKSEALPPPLWQGFTSLQSYNRAYLLP